MMKMVSFAAEGSATRRLYRAPVFKIFQLLGRDPSDFGGRNHLPYEVRTPCFLSHCPPCTTRQNRKRAHCHPRREPSEAQDRRGNRRGLERGRKDRMPCRSDFEWRAWVCLQLNVISILVSSVQGNGSRERESEEGGSGVAALA